MTADRIEIDPAVLQNPHGANIERPVVRGTGRPVGDALRKPPRAG